MPIYEPVHALPVSLTHMHARTHTMPANKSNDHVVFDSSNKIIMVHLNLCVRSPGPTPVIVGWNRKSYTATYRINAVLKRQSWAF